MNVLVVSVHPDDETVGCAGSILKHCAQGDSVSWLIVTSAFEPKWKANEIARKSDEVLAVAAALGVSRVMRLGFQSTLLDTVPQSDLMTSLRNAFEDAKPEWVYLVNRSDVHSDHRAAFEAVMAVLKPFHLGATVRRILCYETLSSTDATPALLERAFVPAAFADITPYIEKKLAVMELYQSEIQPFPQPRSLETIRALGRVRGATIGVGYAEAFMILREIL